uniref:FH2 domain-containing protein n=1 Tax=Macrostomum lignano TaxID=282301 RepID=A0A1I8FKY0_9PLAT
EAAATGRKSRDDGATGCANPGGCWRLAGLKPEMRQQLTGCLRTLEAELAAAAPAVVRFLSMLTVCLNALLGQQASDSCQPLPPPQSMPPPGRQHQQSRVRPEPVFKDLFRWRVNVPDMPEFPQIGCDPRLLAPAKRPPLRQLKNSRLMERFARWCLDRIQPLLILDEQPRAPSLQNAQPGGRFCSEWTPTSLLSCALTPARKALLSNGRPVTPSLDICPTIPRSVLRWATDGGIRSPPAFAPAAFES